MQAYNPLMRAAAIGNVKVVENLLARGMDVNQRGPRGSTALMFAASSGHLDVVKLLVANGADVTATEDGGWTAKRHAEEDRDEELIRYFERLDWKKA